MNEIKEYTEKMFEDIKHVDEFGHDWKFDLRLVIDENVNGLIGTTYNYMDAQRTNNEYLRDKFFKKFRQVVIDRMNIPVPEKKYEFEYTIYFIGGDTITDIFTIDELSSLGVIPADIDKIETNDIIKTFLNFE